MNETFCFSVDSEITLDKIADYIESEITSNRQGPDNMIIKVDSIVIVFDAGTETERTTPPFHSKEEFCKYMGLS